MSHRYPQLPAIAGCFALTATLVAGAGYSALDAGPDRASLRHVAASDDAVDHVVAISLDGLNPDALTTLGPAGVPSFYRLMDQGASTLNARTEHERTNTLPNHTGMVTGRAVALAYGGHGVTFNSDSGKTVHASAGGYVRSVFEVVHNRGGSTAFYSSKDKFDFLDRSWNGTYGAPDRVGVDNGRDKIDQYVLDDEAANVTRLVHQLQADPATFSFLHLAHPDRAGHASGFGGAAYLDAVQQADREVGRVVDAIASDPYLSAHTAVVLTSDHGGVGFHHSKATNVENYTVPFMVWGPGVAQGQNLYTLNPDHRRPPGTERTTYAGTQPIRNGALANLATDLLDLRGVPGSRFNSPQLLNVS